VLRVICIAAGCGKTHAVLPDFIMPYKRYSVDVIEDALLCYERTGKLSECSAPAETSTINRWLSCFRNKSKLVVDRLHAILFSLHGGAVSVIKLRAKTIWERISCLLRAFVQLIPGFSECSSIIGTTNIILTNYGSGFI
jgi:hypothetical protein